MAFTIPKIVAHFKTDVAKALSAGARHPLPAKPHESNLG